MLARYILSTCVHLTVCLSVCRSVRLLHAGFVPKQLNLVSRKLRGKQRHTIAQGLYSSLTPKISSKFKRGETRAQNRGGGKERKEKEEYLYSAIYT